MYREQRIFVVIPAYNESAHIEAVVRGIPPWIDHVIVVDDGSTDGTADLATSAERSVLVIRHPRNQGVGAAITAGYLRALEEGADVVAVMAGDGQMSPTELASLVEPVVDGAADYVKGDRTTHPLVTLRMPSWRRLGNAVLSRWTGWLTGYTLRDAQCGYTVIGATTLERLPLEALTRGYGQLAKRSTSLGRALCRGSRDGLGRSGPPRLRLCAVVEGGGVASSRGTIIDRSPTGDHAAASPVEPGGVAVDPGCAAPHCAGCVTERPARSLARQLVADRDRCSSRCALRRCAARLGCGSG
jgi:hypothetical protein